MRNDKIQVAYYTKPENKELITEQAKRERKHVTVFIDDIVMKYINRKK